MAKSENQIKGSYKNILGEYFNSSIEEKMLGKRFYPNAHSTAIELGNELGFKGEESLSIGAGIIASLSPQTEWLRNLQYAYEFVQTKECKMQTKANNNKATLILNGTDPMTVLGKGSYKVKAFYKAIVDPYGDNYITDVSGFKDNKTNLAVIDRHAGGIYFGYPLVERERRQLSNWKTINRISKGYFKVARGLNLPVNEVQAVTWHSFRNKYKGKVAMTIRKGLERYGSMKHC